MKPNAQNSEFIPQKKKKKKKSHRNSDNEWLSMVSLDLQKKKEKKRNRNSDTVRFSMNGTIIRPSWPQLKNFGLVLGKLVGDALC